MRRTRRCTLVWAALTAMLLSHIPCGASEPARTFFDAVEAYKSGDYGAAAEQFESIARTGVRNGRLYYNLGNAYLKDNQLGPAVLWYERAMILMPKDPDLLFNLTHAQSLTRDAPEELHSPLMRILFFWKYQLSAQAIIYLALGFNLLFWMLLGLQRWLHRRGLARAILLVAGAALLFSATAGFNYLEAGQASRAIVLAELVAVRSGLEPNSTELFILHAGAKVKVLKQRNAHYQVRYGADKIGWVDQKEIGLI
ncbi:MAG: hypothetical protein VR64_17660 [Desulfatitalea sp. BRH_c12]|nr:MAG: hypothetical protein VR64_17660 [Desulfatitalea sp. BRH_c12]